MKYTKSFNYPITDERLIAHLNNIHQIFQSEWIRVMKIDKIKNNDFSIDALSKTKRSLFWKQIELLLGQGYKTWEVAVSSKISRMFCETLRQSLLSVKERQEIAKILQKYGWKITQKVREELTQNKLFPTNALLRNLCKSKSIPLPSADFSGKIDYSTQDKQTILKDGILPNYKIKLSSKEWVEFNPEIPQYVKDKQLDIIKFSSPAFHKNENGKWIATISYTFEVETPNNDRTVGIDLGLVKPFTAVAIDEKPKEIITPEINCRRLTQRINDKVRRISKNLKDVANKIYRYNKILKTQENKDIQNKKIRLELEKRLLKDKRKRLKKQLGKLIASNIRTIAKVLKISKVKVEDLSWLASKGGKWDHSQQQTYIEQALTEIGVKVEKVNCKNTSRANPFNPEEIATAKSDRVIHFQGFNLDRDLVGAINIACRKKNSKNIVPKFSKLLYLSAIKKEEALNKYSKIA